MVFMGCGFTSGEQGESLPLVLKDKRSCFSQASLYSWLLTACLPSGSGMLNWHLEKTVMHNDYK